MTRIFHWFFMWKMNPMLGCDIRLVFTLPPRDSTLQYKRCVHLWNNFPCIITLGRGRGVGALSGVCSKNCSNFVSDIWRMNSSFLTLFKEKIFIYQVVSLTYGSRKFRIVETLMIVYPKVRISQVLYDPRIVYPKVRISLLSYDPKIVLPKDRITQGSYNPRIV